MFEYWWVYKERELDQSRDRLKHRHKLLFSGHVLPYTALRLCEETPLTRPFPDEAT